jgi:hypothetical protein
MSEEDVVKTCNSRFDEDPSQRELVLTGSPQQEAYHNHLALPSHPPNPSMIN